MSKMEFSDEQDVQDVSRFLNAIDAFVKTESSAVDAEFVETSALKNQRAEEEISREINDMVKKKLKDYKHKIFVELSIKKVKEKQKLYNLRYRLLKNLWQKCENSLKDFVSSENYTKFLQSACEKIKNYCVVYKSQSDYHFKVFLKKTDLVHEKMIKDFFGDNVEIFESHDIKIGGIQVLLVGSNKLFDETIDEKFLSAKSKFISKFAYTLNEVGEENE